VYVFLFEGNRKVKIFMVYSLIGAYEIERDKSNPLGLNCLIKPVISSLVAELKNIGFSEKLKLKSSLVCFWLYF